MSQRCLLYVMNVLKMSFVYYRCLKIVFCTLWMSQQCLLFVMDVSKMSFVRYECLNDVFCTLWMSPRCLLYVIVMNVSKMSFVRYECTGYDDLFNLFFCSHTNFVSTISWYLVLELLSLVYRRIVSFEYIEYKNVFWIHTNPWSVVSITTSL